MESNTNTIPQTRITANEVLDRVPVATIMKALGFTLPRTGTRTRCILHGGDGLSFSYHEGKGVWRCHRCNVGGGKIALVRRALGCEPKAALEWIADLAGISLGAPWTETERRDYSERTKRATPEALALIDWKQSIIEALRLKRDFYQDRYHAAKRYLFAHPATDGQFLTELSWEIQFTYWGKVEWLDAQIEKVQSAPYTELLPLFRESQGALAA